MYLCGVWSDSLWASPLHHHIGVGSDHLSLVMGDGTDNVPEVLLLVWVLGCTSAGYVQEPVWGTVDTAGA